MPSREERAARRRRHQAQAWACCLSWGLMGLAGCATFNSKYQEAGASSGSKITTPDLISTAIGKSARQKAAKRRAAIGEDQSAAGTTQTTLKPIITTAAGSRVTITTKSHIHQVAFSQKDPAGQAAADGIAVPDADGGDSQKPGTSSLSLPATTEIPAMDNSVELESPAGASGINLNQTINFCLVADPVIRAGLESINQSNADALTASLAPNPEFFTDIQLLPLTNNFTPTRQGGPPQFDAIMSYPIDWFLFGKRAAMMRATDLGIRVSQSEYQDLIRVRVLEAAVSYYGVLEAKALRDVARQDVENFRRIETLTSSAVDNGGRAKVELNRIRLDRLRSEQSLRDAENSLVAAMARLRVLLGRDDTDITFDVVGSLESSNLIVPLPLDEAVQTAEQNRPDMEAARWKIAQADAVTESERRKAYPTIVPGFGYTRQYQNRAIGFPDANSWLANVSMSVPLFDRNQGNQAKASSVAAQVGYQLQARRVALRGEVVKATQDLNTSAANAQAVAQEQLEIAQQVRDSINSAYEAGGRPLLDALDAQRNYRETYRLYITSRANYARASIQYSATLGQQMTQ
ncbi:MAG: TolC family protein [Planctomycetota bacterium]